MTTKKAAASARNRGRKPRDGQNTEGNTVRRNTSGLLPPWPKGVSGNPGGRPKHDVAAQIAQAVIEGNVEAAIRAFAKKLRKGDVKVFEKLAERGYGKAPQHIEVDGNVTASVKVTFENVAATAQP